MTHKLIKTDNYLFAIDEQVVLLDSGDYYILEDIQHPWRWRGEGRRPLTELSYKIIAHLPLNGSRILEDLAILPPYYPMEFECETEPYTVGEMSEMPLGTVNQKPKTITTAQGIQWVGKYK